MEKTAFSDMFNHWIEYAGLRQQTDIRRSGYETPVPVPEPLAEVLKKRERG